MFYKLLILLILRCSLGENFGWSEDEYKYEIELLNIVGNSSKMDLNRYHENTEPVFGSGPTHDILPYRNLGAFIVMVNSDSFQGLKQEMESSDFQLEIANEYENQGFLLYLSPDTLRWVLDRNEVYLVEEDLRIDINQDVSKDCDLPWGIDRIDRDGKIDCQYDTGDLKGDGSHIYIVDSGIYQNHEEFIGRLGEGVTFVPDTQDWNDCNGHGTHVAGTAAGTNYGVAKKAILHSVRVFGCKGSGYASWVLNGLQWIKNHVKTNGLKNVVVSMSLGGPNHETSKLLVNSLVDEGIVVVVSAGNENTDACTKTPANAAKAITVASSTKNNIRSGFSNYGSCVDVFAPGSDIKSSWIGNPLSTATASGTSMSTPHVSGVVALLYDYGDRMGMTLTPNKIRDLLLELAERDQVTDSKSMQNYLVRTPYFKITTSPTIYPTRSPTIYPSLRPTKEPTIKEGPTIWEVIIMIVLLLLFVLVVSWLIYECCLKETRRSRGTVSIVELEESLGAMSR